MSFSEADGIRYFHSDLLDVHGVPHGVFTRRGGVSQAPWASLNVGGLSGDDPEHVQENQRRTFQSLGFSLESLYDVWQVHSREVVWSDTPRPPQQPHLKADAILTDHPEVTLFMRFADCVPVLLYDPAKKVCGIVHAGWVGTVSKIAAFAIQAMHDRYGTQPTDVLAVIGPSIGQHHYEVGADVIARVRGAFGEAAAGLLQYQPDLEAEKAQLDLWAANRLVLEESGVRQVEISGICTACHLDDWYSHRGEAGVTGRFGALIHLPV
jgi:polyphenol oxidase